MSHPAGAATLVLSLLLASAGAGCLDGLLQEPTDDTAHAGTAAPTPQPGSDPQPAPPDDQPPARDPWQEAYDRWLSCPRSGGPIYPCPHPHPETAAPGSVFPTADGFSLRHHVTDTRWITSVVGLHPGNTPSHVQLDISTPDAQGTIVGRSLPANGTFHFYVDQPGTCYDCGYSIAMSATPYPPEEIGYRLTIEDADANGNRSTGDRFILERDASNTTNAFDAPLLAGSYTFGLYGNSRLDLAHDGQDIAHTWLVSTSDARTPGWTLTVRHDFGADTHPTTSAVFALPERDVTIPLPEDGNATHVFYISDQRGSRHTCPTRDDCVTATPPSYGPAYRVTFHDADGDGRYQIGDHIRIDHDVGNATDGERTWNHAFPYGHYHLDLHDAQEHTIASGRGTVYDGRTP